MSPAVDSAGRVVIPKSLRETARLRPGTSVRFRLKSSGVLIEPAPLSVRFERHGAMVVANAETPVPRLSSDDVTRAIAEIRENTTDTEPDEWSGSAATPMS